MSESAQPGLCLLLREEPRALPTLSAEQRCAISTSTCASMKACWRWARTIILCRASLRRQAVVEQFDVERFVAAVAGLKVQRMAEAMTEDLLRLV